MPERLKQEILEELNDAWLNISVNKDQLIRPLDILDSDDPDIFYKKLTWLMTNPDYFAFLCKHIFNIELLPFQSMILKELYYRRSLKMHELKKIKKIQKLILKNLPIWSNFLINMIISFSKNFS